jgi:hypothetical protein
MLPRRKLGPGLHKAGTWVGALPPGCLWLSPASTRGNGEGWPSYVLAFALHLSETPRKPLLATTRDPLVESPLLQTRATHASVGPSVRIPAGSLPPCETSPMHSIIPPPVRPESKTSAGRSGRSDRGTVGSGAASRLRDGIGFVSRLAPPQPADFRSHEPDARRIPTRLSASAFPVS